MSLSSRFAPFAPLVLAAGLLLAPNLAFAARTVTGVSINSTTMTSGNSTSVTGGTSMPASVTVSITSNSDWDSTGWRIATTAPVSDSDYACVNTSDTSSNGSHTRNFSVTAPTLPGAYNVYIQTFSNDTCSSGFSGSFSYNGGVIVPKLSQTITFAALSGMTYGDADFALGASASSGLTVSYSTTGACSILGLNTLHLTGAGSCSVTATQSGNSTYNAASNVIRTFTVAQKVLTISGMTANSKVYDATTAATLSGTASLAGVINSDDVSLIGSPTATFANKNVGTGKAVSVTGYNLSGTAVGSYTLTQPTGLSADITTKTLTVTALAANKVYDGTTNATAFMGDDRIGGDVLTVAYTGANFDAPDVSTTTPRPVSVTGISIFGTDSGNYTLGNTTVSASAFITQQSASITLDISNLTRTYDGTAQSVPVIGTLPAGLTYQVLYNGLPTAPTNAGTYSVDATITDPNYSGTAHATLVINQKVQVITFGSLADKTYGEADFGVSATSDSGLIVTFSALGNCVVSGATVHLTGAGSCTITADQSGNVNYSAASSVVQSFTINPPTTNSITVVVRIIDLDTTSSSPAVVRADGLNKWFFYNDTTDMVDNMLGFFVAGPGTAPLGAGSVEFTLGSSPSDRKNVATYQFASTSLASITALSFSAYSHSGVAGATESPFMAFNIDFNGSNTWQKRLVYVPSDNGSVPQDAWNTFDTISGGAGKWKYSGTNWPAGITSGGAILGTTARTWSEILADYPNARILPSDGWFGVRVGEPGPANYIGNVDNITVGIQTGTVVNQTTFDFEPPAAPSCTGSSTFDSFTLGSVNGQGGWRVSNSMFDQAVVANHYGYSTFGCQTLRISDSYTSDSFGDQLFAPTTTNMAGESVASAGIYSAGTRQTHFETQFDIASAVPGAQQSGLHMSVSPDRGDGARMSYLRFEDRADGIHVFFDDAINLGPVGSSTVWNETDIATLDRTTAHTIKFSIDFADGAANDVVKIYIDGVLKHTGGSWEDYYRYDPEQSGAGNLVPTVATVLFRESGVASVSNNGKGFLIDNFSETSSTPTTPAPQAPTTGGGGNGPIVGTFGNAAPVGAVLGISTVAGENQGQVLGTSTTSCNAPLLTTYMGMGKQNDPSQVKLLQAFLNSEMGTSLAVSGFFGVATEQAVKAFQLKYKDDILTPWGLTQPTGYVYKFTQRKINLLNCSSLNIPVPTTN